MFTLGLALAESFGSGSFVLLYLGTFFIDMCLIEQLPKCFNKKDKQ